MSFRIHSPNVVGTYIINNVVWKIKYKYARLREYTMEKSRAVFNLEYLTTRAYNFVLKTLVTQGGRKIDFMGGGGTRGGSILVVDL